MEKALSEDKAFLKDVHFWAEQAANPEDRSATNNKIPQNNRLVNKSLSVIISDITEGNRRAKYEQLEKMDSILYSRTESVHGETPHGGESPDDSNIPQSGKKSMGLVLMARTATSKTQKTDVAKKPTVAAEKTAVTEKAEQKNADGLPFKVDSDGTVNVWSVKRAGRKVTGSTGDVITFDEKGFAKVKLEDARRFKEVQGFSFKG